MQEAKFSKCRVLKKYNQNNVVMFKCVMSCEIFKNMRQLKIGSILNKLNKISRLCRRRKNGTLMIMK